MKRSPLKRKKPLRKQSYKRAKLQAKRREFVREQLEKRPICEAGPLIGPFHGQTYRWSECEVAATELHEPLTRARAPGADTILNPKNAIAICRRCHSFCHLNPESATELGLLIPSWRTIK